MTKPRQFTKPPYGMAWLITAQIVVTVFDAGTLYANASAHHGWWAALSGGTLGIMAYNAVTLANIWRMRKRTAELNRLTEILRAQSRAFDWRDHHA